MKSEDLKNKGQTLAPYASPSVKVIEVAAQRVMKKTILSIAVIAAAIFAASCQKENLQENTATTGTAKATIGGSEVDVNWVQLWAGGPKFAEYNVGAENNNAEDYGGYYNWGMSEVQTSSNYGKYKQDTDPLTGTDDTATNLWGSNWRMPTKAEFENLLSNCNVAWTTVNGKNGCKFTGKGAYASNSVFLPAVGYCYFGSVYDYGYVGYYWSSTPDVSGRAYGLLFYSGSRYVHDEHRSSGYSVRAVLTD